MTTSIPLVKESGETKQLPSGYKLGGVTGGTTTGEVMTQDQFGTNSTKMGVSGNPVFNSVVTTSIVGQTTLSLIPNPGDDVDVLLSGTASKFHAQFTDTSGSSSPVVVQTTHNTSGTPTIGYGLINRISLQSSTTADQILADVTATWATAVHASRKGRVAYTVYDTAARQCLIMEASGSAAMIGFLGANASAQLVSPDIATALTTFGLASGSPTLAVSKVSGLGTGVATFLATPSSANLAAAVTGETGSGALVFGTSPTLTNAIINQAADGDTAIKSVRFTDTTPTGNFLDFQNAAASSIFAIDRFGKQTVNLTAQASTAEVLAVWQVSDSLSKFQVTNGTANASEFAPVFEGIIEATKVSTALSFFGTKGANDTTNPAILFLTRYNSGSGNTDLTSTTCMAEFRNRATTVLQVFPVSLTCKDAFDIVVGTSTGTKIGTSTSQKLSLWNKTPIVQPTTSITGATFVANSGTTVNDASTFGGYTLKQLAAAMINFGLVA